MSITSITRDWGTSLPNIVRVITTDNLATVESANYILNQTDNINNYNNGIWEWLPSDVVLVGASDGSDFFVFNNGDFSTLLPVAANTTLPVVDNDFAVFDGTLGAIKDAGYSPTDATKTKVVMLNAAVTAGNVAAFTNVNGTIGNGPVNSNQILTSAIMTPDIGANLVFFDVTVAFSALSAGASVILYSSTNLKQYKIRLLQLNMGGTNFAGGDRDGQITDGTSVYSVIPAATMQALVNAEWGSTNLPFPTAVAINTNTVAGENLVFEYSGGTTDYTSGSLVISGILQRVV